MRSSASFVSCRAAGPTGTARPRGPARSATSTFRSSGWRARRSGRPPTACLPPGGPGPSPARPDMRLHGRVALVTGAGRRVGRALAVGLGAEGARVAVHYNGSAAGAQETAEQIVRAGGEARVFQANLSDADAPARLVDDVAAAFAGLDVLVNSAAVMHRTPI